VIPFFCIFPLSGIANLNGIRLLTHLTGLREADAEKSRLGYAVGSGLSIGEKMPTSPGKPARGRLHRFPKRNLSPLHRACLSLGLPVDARPRTNLARRLRRAGLGKTAIEDLKFAKGEQARQIVELFYTLNTATERKDVTIDYLIMAAGADDHQVWGLIQEGVSRRSEDETRLLVAVHAPDVTRKAIEYALTPNGFKDRELVLRIAGPLWS
jgi:hypothetical protein